MGGVGPHCVRGVSWFIWCKCAHGLIMVNVYHWKMQTLWVWSFGFLCSERVGHEGCPSSHPTRFAVCAVFAMLKTAGLSSEYVVGRPVFIHWYMCSLLYMRLALVSLCYTWSVNIKRFSILKRHFKNENPIHSLPFQREKGECIGKREVCLLFFQGLGALPRCAAVGWTSIKKNRHFVYIVSIDLPFIKLGPPRRRESFCWNRRTGLFWGRSVLEHAFPRGQVDSVDVNSIANPSTNEKDKRWKGRAGVLSIFINVHIEIRIPQCIEQPYAVKFEIVPFSYQHRLFLSLVVSWFVRIGLSSINKCSQCIRHTGKGQELHPTWYEGKELVKVKERNW
jgi:hypothetical protein